MRNIAFEILEVLFNLFDNLCELRSKKKLSKTEAHENTIWNYGSNQIEVLAFIPFTFFNSELFQQFPTLIFQKISIKNFMLKISQFKKSYSTGFELKIDSLQLPKGIHLIKGENGSGKSTLLKAIAGIHDFGGDITLEGIAIKKDPVRFRKIVNYSDAEPMFPDFLNLDELIAFVADTKGADSAQIHHLKTELGIGGYAKNPLASYSSGMLKKAGLILAFIGNPRLIILDEPFTTIDVETQARLKKLVLSHVADGKSFLITSHLADFEKLFEYSSILEITDGKLSKVYG
jgi:ABC-2 type transport system ATP-binding protein